MGLALASLQTPLTVPEACEKSAGAESPSIKRTKTITAKCLFIMASRRNTELSNTRFLKADSGARFANRGARSAAQSTIKAQSWPTVAYGTGSVAPAAANARKRNTQLSQTPHA